MISIVKRQDHVPTDSDFYIGRPGVLGNMYTHLPHLPTNCIKVDNRQQAVEAYEAWLSEKVNARDPMILAELRKIQAMLDKHGYVNLVCWCAPKLCHGLVIAQYLEEK